MADNLVFEESLNTEIDSSEFISKKWIYVNDNNAQNYTSQVVIDTTPLSNAGGWVNWSEGFIVMPLVVQLTNATNAGRLSADTNLADYSWAFKNGFWNMIDSMTVEFNNQNVVQQTPFLNVFRSFKSMTSWSLDDLLNHGPSSGFSPDDADAWYYSPDSSAFTARGINCGITNNASGRVINSFVGAIAVPSPVPTTVSGVPAYGISNIAGAPTVAASALTYGGAGVPNLQSVNEGMYARQSWVGYDVSGSATANSNGQATLNPLSAMRSNYRAAKVSVDGQGVVWNVYAKLRLKDLADFFDKSPLLKGSTMRFYINTNQSLVSYTITKPVVNASSVITTDPILTVSSVNILGGRSCPLMLASAEAGQGSSPLWGQTDGTTPDTLQLSVSIFKNNQVQSTGGSQVSGASTALSACRLYAPVYTFNPIAESKYLSLAPTKRVKYNDIFQYQFNSIAANDNFNFLVSNGISNIQSVLVVPFLSKASFAVSSLNTPVNSTPATPSPIMLTNFNILISGVNLFLNNENYDYEAFCTQLAQSNQLNGGLTTGLASGLISEDAFNKLYRYYYGNASRHLPSEDGVSRSVQIVGQNQSQATIDLMVFVEFQREIVIDVATGARIE